MKNQFFISKQSTFVGSFNAIQAIGKPCHFFLIGLLSIAVASVSWGDTQYYCDPNDFNTVMGVDACSWGDTGMDVTALGFYAFWYTGTSATAIGAYVLENGGSGTALGAWSRNSCPDGNSVGVGYATLANASTGICNTSVGEYALAGTNDYYSSLTGENNTALGYVAMAVASDNASYNTALGAQTMESVADSGNTGVGFQALFAVTTPDTNAGYNTSTGSYSSVSTTSGISNTADGSGALSSNTSDQDTAVGNYALGANTGPDNIALGYNAGEFLTTGSLNIDIGNTGTAGESRITRIGTHGAQFATFIAGVRGIVVTGGQPVVVSSSGQLGVTGSSKRFKEAIQSMDNKSESILALRPVSFRYKKELDPKGSAQFGLIAEEVAKIDPNLVVTDEAGKPFSVRYEEVNAMLLNEFLKEHRRVAEQTKVNEQQAVTLNDQTATINELRQVLAQRQSQIKALRSGLQKVNTKLQMALPTARVVTND